LIDNTSPYQVSYPIEGAAVTDGSYELSVNDRLDNSYSGAPVTVIKDITPPTVSLLVEPAGGYAYTLSWGAQDSQSGPSGLYDVEYREGEAGPWQAWQSQVSVPELAPSSKTSQTPSTPGAVIRNCHCEPPFCGGVAV
jgi:hypothetical protein